MGMNPRLLRPTPAGFDPRRIAGLIAWYDAADVSTMGPTSTGVGTISDNGPVKFLKDKSPSGFDLTNTGADSVCPTYVAGSQNGLSTLLFDTGDELIGQASSGQIMLPAFTFFIALRTTATAVGNPRLCGVATGRSIGTFGGGSTFGFFSVGGSTISFGLGISATCVLAISCAADRVSSFYANGVLGNTGTIASLAAAGFALNRESSTTVGARAGGTIFEVISYNRTFDASEVQLVSRYLGRKWGFGVA
jgi:hypothetical protein